MSKKFPIHPIHPERICWGCDRFCPADLLACSNERAPHPCELFGEDWLEWGNLQGTVPVVPAVPLLDTEP
jgi:Protein of unknown function (DUF3079)